MFVPPKAAFLLLYLALNIDTQVYAATLAQRQRQQLVPSATPVTLPPAPTGWDSLFQDRLIRADIWSLQPEILSAALGFEGIIGVFPTEAAVRAAGGTWMDLPATSGQPPLRTLTSAFPLPAVPNVFGTPAQSTDAMPIVFSWPFLLSTLDATDFAVHLNNGAVAIPTGISIVPCQEFNERNVAVLIGEFSNRGRTGESGAVYPVRVEIVNDGTPLTLVGPMGIRISMVGRSKVSSNPYDVGNGPSLVGAKLSRMSMLGEGGPSGYAGPANGGVDLYGAQAEFRLRVLTTGGFSPNGVSGVRPDDFQTFFRILAEDGGATVAVTQTGVDYALTGGRIRVVGLADLGTGVGPYDLTYLEDYDNYIDIILQGDEAAMRQIRFVEIPAVAPYQPFFNPGGPGNDPTPGVRYTSPGAPDLEPVLMALDNPLVVSSF